MQGVIVKKMDMPRMQYSNECYNKLTFNRMKKKNDSFYIVFHRIF